MEGTAEAGVGPVAVAGGSGREIGFAPWTGMERQEVNVGVGLLRVLGGSGRASGSGAGLGRSVDGPPEERVGLWTAPLGDLALRAGVVVVVRGVRTEGDLGMRDD